MHNGFVRINDEKMSKSLGNFFTVRDVLKSLRDPEVLRFFLLSSHYRGPINYSQAQLIQADETLLGLYRSLAGASGGAGGSVASVSRAQAEGWAAFHAAMDDDFNTPEALAAMQGIARELNIVKAAGDAAAAGELASALRAMGQVLGVLQQPAEEYLRRGVGSGTLPDAEIEHLVQARNAARMAKDFAESDRIRDVLAAAGIVLEDKRGAKTGWRRA
jgi:cysteinyl-tRNA synthetase